MAAPKKILQKRNRNQAETIVDLTEENERLTKENEAFAKYVRWIEGARLTGEELTDAEWRYVIERAGIRFDG
jgi:hypothetical protein